MHEDDKKSFKRALSGIRVLEQDKVFPYLNRPRPVPKQTQRDEKQVVDDLLSEQFDATEVDSGDELLHFTRLTPFRDRLAGRLSGGDSPKHLAIEPDQSGVSVETGRCDDVRINDLSEMAFVAIALSFQISSIAAACSGVRAKRSV